MSPGNFSNGGVATFDEHKRYLGVRLQQGVPLLDRDWNELDDIRRFFERRLRAYYVGEGVPDLDGFEVRAPEFEADNDVVIGAGSCSVASFDVWSEADVLYWSRATACRCRPPIPAATRSSSTSSPRSSSSTRPTTPTSVTPRT